MRISVEITRASTPWVLLGISKPRRAGAGCQREVDRESGGGCAVPAPSTKERNSGSILTILDGYIVREMLSPFCLCIGGFTIILLSGYLFELMDLIFIKKVPAATVMRLLGYKLPSIVVLTLPLAVLFATLLALGRLAKDNELTVMRMAGFSLFRIAAPLLVIGAVVSGITYWANEKVVPEMNHREANLVRRIVFEDAPPSIEEQVFFRDPEGRFFYIGRVDSQRRQLHNIMVYDVKHGPYPRLITAASGEYGENRWYLRDGIVQELDEKGIVENQVRFQHMELPLTGKPERFFGQQKTTSEMSRKELGEHIELFQKSGLQVDDFVVDYHLKLALPFASLIFVLVGAPLCFTFGRGGRMFGVVISLVIMFLYYVVTSVARSMGANGVIPPLLAAWLGNVLFAGLGIGLLARNP
ncbi:MAG: YjgP/YjgQ family permease [Firmicutes bacterium]|nr:YjgP/YjgQ family permease [Bacillota bacterium]